MNPRTIHIFKKFSQYMKDNIARDKYTNVGIKPNNDFLHVITSDEASCAEIREQIGYFFQGVEIKYLVIEQDGNVVS